MHRALLALVVLPALPGCLATRTDVEALQSQIDGLRTAQEQMLRELRQQNAQTLDSLSRQQTRTRGDIANRLLQMERQIVQIQELTGQSQQSVAQLRQQLQERARELDRVRADSTPQAPPTASAAEAQEVYDTALAAYQRRSFSTARGGFEEFLRVAPQHRMAADAQFFIGETYAQSGQADPAVQAFTRVVELYPSSARASAALFRVGQVELGRGRRDEARARFNQVVRAYPNAPEAARARTELQRMGTR